MVNPDPAIDPILVTAGQWVHQGVTLAHHPKTGKPVFVHGAIPNEKVMLQITKKRKQHMYANVTRVIEKAANRIEDACHVFPDCGGCSFKHIAYEQERQIKQKLLTEWKFINSCMQEVSWNFFFNSPVSYRNHVQVQNINNRWGFFGLNSNRLVEFGERGCVNVPREILDVIQATSMNKNGRYSFRLTAEGAFLVEENKFLTESIVFSDGTCLKWKYPSRGFWQINRFLLPVWADQIRTYFQSRENLDVVEFFCGSGLIGGLIQGQLIKYEGFDSDGRSLRAARMNFSNSKVHTSFTKINLYNRLPEYQENWEVCLVNPPRSGLTKDIIKKICDSNIQTILYSSCNPATLNRDLEVFLKNGFKPGKLDVFDFFPGSWHLEVLIILERKL